VNIRTETKAFGHTFMRQSAPLQAGWYCCCCGYFVVGQLTDAEKKRTCGRVTYPAPVPVAR
jgi:hypothetical protein